jgi:hypothetical protein
MSDKLYHAPVIGHELTALGVSKTTDDYGNSLSGRIVTCNDGSTHVLSALETVRMNQVIGMSADGDWIPDGQTTVLDPAGSPLEVACHPKLPQSTKLNSR